MPTKLALLLTAGGASIATAAAIALPAIGDDGTKSPSGAQHVAVAGPGPAALRACLKSKGLNPPDDDVALKQWIGEQISAGKADEIKGCAISADGKTPQGDDRPGPSFSDLQKCLKDKGFNAPDDPRGLKEWIRPHDIAGDAAGQAARACVESLPSKPPSEYGPSEKKRFGSGG